MRPRSLARRLAFQYLFIHDMNRGDCETSASFLDANTDVRAVCEYSEVLIRGAVRQSDEIDNILQKAVSNYSLTRLAAVERNVLRLGVAELLEGDTPFRVVIDEAVKLAKKFGGKDSSRFVNGILDEVARELSSGDGRQEG